MSLQGSLDTFALADVLRLLASTNKTGELQVKTRRTAGQIWVRDGSLVGGAAGEIRDTVDVVFELLRSLEGSFTFVPDRPAARPTAPMNVDGVLLEVEDRLTEWREIEKVIPSLSAHLTLQAHIQQQVMLSVDQWEIVAAIGSGTKVQQVMKTLELNEFVACKEVKGLVELGLVDVGAHESDALFNEPETDVSIFNPPEEDALEPVSEQVLEGALEEALDEATTTAGVSDEDALARWEEIRQLAQVDNADAEEELSPEEQERAKALIEAQGVETPTGEPINRGLLLKFLASAQV